VENKHAGEGAATEERWLCPALFLRSSCLCLKRALSAEKKEKSYFLSDQYVQGTILGVVPA